LEGDVDFKERPKCPKCGAEKIEGLECPVCGIVYEKYISMNKSKTLTPSVFANYEKYEQYTREKEWKKICKINEVDFDSFGTKKELKVLADYLGNNETVFAFASGIMRQTSTSNAFDWGTNTWLVVLTNERFLFLDHAMMTKSVDTQSIRHSSVQAVSASQGLVLGKIQIDLGARVVVVDNCQKASVKVIADLANKWLKVLENEKAAPGGSGSGVSLLEMKEIAELIRTQNKNQERIISLLEEMKENSASFYSRVARKK
jgi:hypothetical protein